MCEYLQANVRLYANIRFKTTILKRIIASRRIFASAYIVLDQIEYFYANLCKYFEAKMKRMMPINGVCEYTKTCEYEANKIHIRLGSLRSE